MANNNLNRAAKLLEQASNLLKSETNRPEQPIQASQNKLQETLDRASNMLRESSSSGLVRRLNRSERLRAANPSQRGQSRLSTSRKTPPIPKPKKAMEFALLRCFDEDECGGEEPHYLKWDTVLADGMLMIGENDDEKETSIAK